MFANLLRHSHRRTLAWAFALLAGAGPLAAATQVTVLVDGDHNDATGCTVTTVDGPFAGVDWRYVATIDGNDASQAVVTSYTVEPCVGPGFGAPTAVTTPFAAPWNVGLGLGDGGLDVLEAFVPTGGIGPTVQLGFMTQSDGAAPAADALLSIDGTGPTTGEPILLQLLSILEIPTVGEWGLLLLAAVLAGLGLAVVRRRRGAGVGIGAGLTAAVLVLAAAGLAWAAIVPNGDPSDWGAELPKGDDTTGDSALGAEMGPAWARVEGTTLFWRVDLDLRFPPRLVSGNPNSVTFTEGGPAVAVAPNLVVVDPDQQIAAATVTITNLLDGAAEALAATTAGTSISAAYTPATGVLTLTGPDTRANFQTVLRSVNYVNADLTPTTTARTVSFVVTDGIDTSNTINRTVNVAEIDDPPTAVADAATVAEDSGATAVAVLTNDTDPDAGPMTIAAVTQPANGTVVITGGGSGLTYAPNLNYCNTPPGTTLDTFTYTLSPGGSIGTVTMTVTCLNDTPQIDLDANDDKGTGGADFAATFTEGGAALAIVDPADATVVDVDHATLASLTVTLTNLLDTGFETLSAVTGGTSIAANYTPATGVLTLTGPDTVANFQTVLRTVRYQNTDNAPDTGAARVIQFVANDGVGNGNVATATVTVIAIDTAPTAVADAATVNEDSGANTIDVQANDTDPDAGTNTITAVTQPTNGTVAITNGGADLTYTPNANYCNNPPGTTLDTFTYTLTPGGSSATVTVTVTCVDDAPVAVNDAATVNEDAAATAVPVLANDTDPDGGAISITSVTQPTNGTVVITGGGTGLTYQPNADYCNNPPGTTLDTFTYTLTPGGSSATVTMTVTCVDDDPVAVNDAATVNEDSGANAIDALANDTDVDGGAISITSVTQPANGTVVITGGGTGLTYQPNANYCNNPPGTTLDTFTYTLTPGGSSATVTVTVTCIDDPPTAVADAATVNEDAGASAIPVLANDLDTDGGPIAITSVTQPTNGTVVITGGGTGLTYAPNPNYCNNPPGTTLDTFTYTLTPGGSSATVTMTVTCVNDGPQIDLDANDDQGTGGANFALTFTEGDPATLLEDPADAIVSDVDSTTLASLTVTITNLFDTGAETLSTDTTGTSISANYATVPGAPGTGTLTLTGPDTLGNFTTVLRKVRYQNTSNAPNATARIVNFVANDGSNNGNTAVATVTVVGVDTEPTAVNDAATVAEDAAATTIDVLANDTDPDGGPISITSVTQPTNGTVVITGGGTGLTYQPDPNYCNSVSGPLDTFTYTLTPGGSSATVSVTVTCVDDNPVAVADAATVTEDAGATAVAVLGNDTDVDGGPISITSVTQPTNGTVIITGGGTGLTYAPNANYCNNPPGTTLDTFTYTLTPGGSSATVTMTVTCVDDNPVAVADAATVVEDSGANAINVLANDTDVDGGAISVTAVTQPANGAVIITGGGTGLSYAPNPNYCNNPPGTTLDTFTYTLTPGGSSTTVTMTVTCVDDPPVAVADAATVNEDSGANAIPVLANDTDPDGGPISIVSVTQPTNGAVVITGGGTGLTYAPNANYCNSLSGPLDTFTYTLTPGGSSTTVTVTVTCINDPPVAGPDAFDFVGNTELVVDLAALATPHALETTTSTNGVLDNDSDPVEGHAISVTAITVGLCTDASAPLDCSDPAVGRVQMDSNGRFRFTPAPGDTGATETFQYTVTDNGLPAPASAVGTVTLTRFERVWYVKNDAPAGGNGTSASPFNGILAAQLNDSDIDGDLTDDLDAANDYIFVYFGDGTATNQSGGLLLESGQRLVGEHVGLSLPVDLNGNGSPTNLVAAVPGNRPLINDTVADTTEGVAARNVVPALIAGMNLAGNVNAIDWSTVAAFAGTGTFTIRDNVVRSAANEGVDINLAGTGAVNLAFHDNTLTSTGNALDIQETGTGSLTITRFDDNVVSGDTGGSGIVVNTATFDAIPGGTLDPVSGGATLIGSAGNPVGISGMSMGFTGALDFTDLDIFASGGLVVTGTGSFTGAAGTRLTVANGVGSIATTLGTAVTVSNATLDLRLGALTSSASSSTGVSLTNVSDGTVAPTDAHFSAPSTATIANASGIAFHVDGGNGTISYAGSITNSSGRSVVVENRTGDSVTFTSVSTITDTGSGILVEDNAAGAVTDFLGTLTLSTGANSAFTATNGGTLRVRGATNTLTTTTGVALSVTSTTIGAGSGAPETGLRFRSISSNGAASGIVLNNTGTSGGLTVTGTGGAGSGGTIQNATGDGISLTSTSGVSLSFMNIQNGGEDGIDGAAVNGFSLTSSSVTNNGNAANEEGISLANVSGAVSLASVTVTSSAYNNLRIDNTLGTISALSITNSSFDNNDAGTGNHGALIEIRGTSQLTTATVSGSSFSGNEVMGIQVATGDTATVSAFTFSGNTVTNNELGIDFSKAQTSNLTFSILNNTGMTGNNSHGINLFTAVGAGTTGVFRGRIENNTIGNSAVAGSGSAIGNCIRVNINGDALASVLINGNTLRQCPNGRGIEVIGRNGTGGLDVTVTNNDVNPQDTSGFPLAAILVQSNCATVCNTVRSDVRGNSVPAGATTDLLPTFVALVETSTSVLQLVDTPPASASCTDQLTSNNTGSASASAGCALIAGPITTP
jgi:hypothetical protein